MVSVKSDDTQCQLNKALNPAFSKENVHRVLVSAAFMDQLFQNDQFYKNSPTFQHGSSSVKLYHVTRSDILTAISLFISCNTVGEINEITYNRLFEQRIKPLYNKFLSYQEFVLSIHKFSELKLLKISQNPITKRYNLKINHFLQEGSDSSAPVPERYISLHPFIFEERFLRQSIDYWKMYLRYIVQCNMTSSPRYYYFNQDKENYISHLQSSDLRTFLNKKENHQVKQVIQKLTSVEILPGEGPLFTSTGNGPLITKRFKRFHEVGLKINPSYLSHRSITTEARFPLAIEERYQRESKFIQNYLEALGVGELYHVELKGKFNGSLAKNLVYRLKSYSKGMVKIALDELAAEFKMFKRIPSNLDAFISTALRFKKQTEFKRILRDENLYTLLIRGWKATEREDRIYEFLNVLSPLKVNEFKAFCRHGYKSLKATYQRSTISEGDYRCSVELDNIPGIDLLRRTAYKLEVDPLEYNKQEESLAKLIPLATDNTEVGSLIHTVFKRLNSLGKHQGSHLDLGKVKLESILLDEWLKTGSKHFQKRISQVYYHLKSLRITL